MSTDECILRALSGLWLHVCDTWSILSEWWETQVVWPASQLFTGTGRPSDADARGSLLIVTGDWGDTTKLLGCKRIYARHFPLCIKSMPPELASVMHYLLAEEIHLVKISVRKGTKDLFDCFVFNESDGAVTLPVVH